MGYSLDLTKVTGLSPNLNSSSGSDGHVQLQQQQRARAQSAASRRPSTSASHARSSSRGRDGSHARSGSRGREGSVGLRTSWDRDGREVRAHDGATANAVANQDGLGGGMSLGRTRQRPGTANALLRDTTTITNDNHAGHGLATDEIMQMQSHQTTRQSKRS